MDGTLIDSIPSVVRSWVRWCEEYGVDPTLLTGLHGVPAVQVIERLLPQRGREAAFARIRELEVADATSVGLHPGAQELLGALAAGGGLHAIVTSCTDDLAAARIAATGLQVPEVVVTADQTSRGKPAPDPYLEAARRLGVDPAACLVVEDAPAGAESARAAGCSVLAVLTTASRAELEPLADLVVSGIDAVTATVGPDGIRVRATA
jgi:sugar-phosphatase